MKALQFNMLLEVNNVYNIDCAEGVGLLERDCVDACITDPPYELNFMDNTWDNTGISHSIDLWKEVLRVLKPGRHYIGFDINSEYYDIAEKRIKEYTEDNKHNK
jgi:DNA modification methylase